MGCAERPRRHAHPVPGRGRRRQAAAGRRQPRRRAVARALTDPARQSPGECAPEAIQAVLDLVDERWGGAAGYLLAHGLPPDRLAALRARLIAPTE
ncbi:tyrosine-protein phosphatase [Dactylosporangium aurantiacum]|uniref:tyrosine-protein phosphatase n=1 Tax=Dactylosporangium aurantiacum TaxID=35754 RepID=UPI0024355B66|nr:tyrosine-protein phosphatase [Dactylosporangium aurantiacum]MDG6107013.1 tyrosine-protein phosphatase [Dactylosporangium aurantiacum]